MHMIKRIFVTAVCLLAGLGTLSRAADAPIPPEIENEQIYGINKEAPHATLMPYATLTEALAGKRRESPYARTLNGPWKFNWVKRPELRPVDFYKPDFDVSAWKEIPVPSCWQLLGYGTPVYSNTNYIFRADPPRVMSAPPRTFSSYDERNPVGSYRRDFEVPADWNGRRIFITFDGVDSAFFLWVNGEKVGFSVDSRTPAEFDITKYVKPGKNVLAAEVYRFSAGSYLEDQDMWRLSGIFRNVTLWSAPMVHIRDFFVKPDLDAQYKDATVEVNVKIKNYSDKPKSQMTTWALLFDKTGMEVNEPNPVPVPTLAPGQEQEITLNFKVANPVKWTAETPYLYTTVIIIAGENKLPVELLSTRTGFRKIEIKGSLFLVNGQPIKFKGSNRHENWPDTGHYVSDERMIKDLELLKGCNSNHVRTSHYSDDPRWYELCDEYGIYLVAEANVECHQLQGRLDRAPNWQKAIVERNIANVEQYKNHPSVIIWSLGNECGGGVNFRAAHDAVRKLDPSRPTHYEPFGAGPTNPCEIDSRMYPSVADMKNYGEQQRQKPLYMCEYAHAMTNSMGSIGDYNDVVDAYDNLMGGAIWEWQDQALWNDRDKSQPPYLVFGGGFGDAPTDGVFILKGVVFADRTPTPKYPEVKHAYQWVGFKDLGAGKIELKNRYAFTNLNKFVPVWTVSEDGTVIAKGKLDKLDVAPYATRTVEIPMGKITPQHGAQVILRLAFELEQDELWAKAGTEVAEQQFALPNTTPALPALATTAPAALSLAQDEKQITVSGPGFKAVFAKADGSLTQYTVGETDLITSDGALRLYAYRAPHLNDDNWAIDGWRANGLDALTYHASTVAVAKTDTGAVQVKAAITAAGKGGFGFTHLVVYTVLGDGTIAVDNAITPLAGRRIVLPRLGFRVALDKSLSQFKWLGRGPMENYSDRKRGSDIGLYASTVKDQLTPYVAPMECGNHEDVAWAAVTNAAGTGLLVAAQGAPMQVSALPFSDQQLEKAKFAKDLTGSDATYLCVSARTLGVGQAINKPLIQYFIYSDPICYSYLLRPLTGGAKDLAALARKPAPARVMPVLVHRDRAGLVTLTSSTPNAKISVMADGVAKDYTAPFEFKKAGTLTLTATAPGCLPYSAAAELGKYVEVVLLKAVAASDFQPDEGEIAQAVDGDPETIWHSRHQPRAVAYPHWITVDLGKELKIAGVTCQGRPAGTDNGRIANFEIYASADGKEWGQAVATGRFNRTTAPQNVMLKAPVTCRYLKLVALSAVNGQPYASIAELAVIPAK